MATWRGKTHFSYGIALGLEVLDQYITAHLHLCQ